MSRWIERLTDVGRLLALPYYVLGPYVDNCLGISTQRHLRRFFEFEVGGQPLRQVVESRVARCDWSIRHEGYMWASVVECWATGESLFRWEISHQPPVPWLPRGLYVTPLTRASAALVPELLPVGLRDLRLIPGGRYASGVIYVLAEPEEARAWLAPWTERLTKKLNDPAP